MSLTLHDGKLPPVSLIPVLRLDLRINREFSVKFEMTLTLFSGAWGTMIHEKKHEAKNLVKLSFLIVTFAALADGDSTHIHYTVY